MAIASPRHLHLANTANYRWQLRRSPWMPLLDPPPIGGSHTRVSWARLAERASTGWGSAAGQDCGGERADEHEQPERYRVADT
jgi:hypothetical protein